MSEKDMFAISHLIDERELKRKYEEVLSGGCTPEFAKSYIAEVARSMAVNEAASMSIDTGAIEGLLKR